MSRSEPTVNLQWCESHVIIKAKLSNGQILRLGTAELSNVPESDGNTYQYVAKLSKDSEVHTSTTQAANQMTAEAVNVDKELGLTINDSNSVLTGAEVLCSKVFSPVFSYNINDDSPAFWYDVLQVRDVAPNQEVEQLRDLSLNARHANGEGLLSWKQINGYNSIRLSNTDTFAIPGTFAISQIFAVFKSPTPEFNNNESIVSTSPDAFAFASGTTQFRSPFPVSVRDNGVELSSPFDLGDITKPHILNIKTSSPAVPRNYTIGGLNFYLSELVGFEDVLPSASEQRIEYILARKYGVRLPYVPTRTWESKVLLTGQISKAEVSENVVEISIVSDVAPNVAFIAARPVSEHCPLIYKGRACGYVGPLATCNKIYDSEGGCSGHNNQHRFGGVVVAGELPAPIPGDVDTTIGYGGRFWTGDHFPSAERNRELL